MGIQYWVEVTVIVEKWHIVKMRLKDAKNGEGESLWIGIEITNFVQKEKKKANKKRLISA